jgi:hypothetical protein
VDTFVLIQGVAGSAATICTVSRLTVTTCLSSRTIYIPALPEPSSGSAVFLYGRQPLFLGADAAYHDGTNRESHRYLVSSSRLLAPTNGSTRQAWAIQRNQQSALLKVAKKG